MTAQERYEKAMHGPELSFEDYRKLWMARYREQQRGSLGRQGVKAMILVFVIITITAKCLETFG